MRKPTSGVTMKNSMQQVLRRGKALALLLAAGPAVHAAPLDAAAIEAAAGTPVMVVGDAIRIGWSRDDVPVFVDGQRLPPAAGLGSRVAFEPTGQPDTAMVMGDTVVFQDEVDAAMDAAFAHGLSVTALHNHFFHDEPRVYFMHLGGQGPGPQLAAAVRAVWDAIRTVRSHRQVPATHFAVPPAPHSGPLDADLIGTLTGLEATAAPGGVVKVAIGRTGVLNGTRIDASMGLTSWAAFSGEARATSMDGDIIMTAAEVQPVLRALRDRGLHVVALHNHMIDTRPEFYLTDFWGRGTTGAMATAFQTVLQAQAKASDAAR